MTLVKCIEELARENIGDENRWYDWEINEAKVPAGVKLGCHKARVSGLEC